MSGEYKSVHGRVMFSFPRAIFGHTDLNNYTLAPNFGSTIGEGHKQILRQRYLTARPGAYTGSRAQKVFKTILRSA